MIEKRKGVPVTEGLKEARSKGQADVQEPDPTHTVPDERATDREVHIHQRHRL